MTNTTATITGRWIYGNHSTTGGCRYCGRYADRDCAPVTCRACDTVQCHGNGGGKGTCFVCHNGWLPGWSHDYRVETCGYKGCSEPTVSYAPRVGRVCRTHLERATTRDGGRTRTLAAYIAERIAHRDSGKGWERYRFVER